MGYSFIYLFCVLVLLMLALRFFLPFFIYLFPILIIFWIIKAIFRSRKRTHQSKEDQAYYEQHSSYQNHQSSDPDIIDVDYKVVDEEDNTQ